MGEVVSQPIRQGLESRNVATACGMNIKPVAGAKMDSLEIIGDRE